MIAEAFRIAVPEFANGIVLWRLPSSLKPELVHRTQFHTRQEAKAALFEYIEIFYNRHRRHSGVGYRTPAQAHAAMRNCVSCIWRGESDHEHASSMASSVLFQVAPVCRVLGGIPGPRRVRSWNGEGRGWGERE
jgi:hypothetical protein